MLATIHHLPVAAPQPAPSETDETAAFTRLMSSASFEASAGMVASVLSGRWPDGVPG